MIRLDKSLYSKLHSNTDIPKERVGGAEGKDEEEEEEGESGRVSYLRD